MDPWREQIADGNLPGDDNGCESINICLSTLIKAQSISNATQILCMIYRTCKLRLQYSGEYFCAPQTTLRWRGYGPHERACIDNIHFEGRGGLVKFWQREGRCCDLCTMDTGIKCPYIFCGRRTYVVPYGMQISLVRGERRCDQRWMSRKRCRMKGRDGSALRMHRGRYIGTCSKFIDAIQTCGKQRLTNAYTKCLRLENCIVYV